MYGRFNAYTVSPQHLTDMAAVHLVRRHREVAEIRIIGDHVAQIAIPVPDNPRQVVDELPKLP